MSKEFSELRRRTTGSSIVTNKLTSKCVIVFSDGEDNLLRVADPSFMAACQSETVSRYYNCDIAVSNDTDIVNNRTWLICPTYIGKTLACMLSVIFRPIFIVRYLSCVIAYVYIYTGYIPYVEHFNVNFKTK